MEYRTLGKTGIEVSVIGFGCGNGAKLMVGDDEATRIATISRALEAGINYFDTAYIYGDGRSEANLARALKKLEANPVVSTKIALTVGDLDDPRSAILRNLEGNLERLGRESVDQLVLHNRVIKSSTEFTGRSICGISLDHVYGSNGAAHAYEEIRASGRARSIAFSAFGGNVSAIEEIIDSGVFDNLNAAFNFLNPSAVIEVPSTFSGGVNYGATAKRAADAGMGVMAIKVVAEGQLTGAGPAEGHAAKVAAAALAYGRPLSQVATHYVVSHPEVSIAILGFSEVAHVDDAVAALEEGSLTAEAMRSLEELALQT